MTAEIRYLYRHMPQELCAAEAAEAVAYHASELRQQAAHDGMIEVQEMRPQWSANRKAQRYANRKAQRDAKVGVYHPLFEPVSVSWRIRYALGSLGLVAVFCGYQWSVM